MFLTYLFLVALFLIALLYLYYLHSYTYWKKRNIPQINPTFPFGSTKVVNPGFDLGSITADFYAEFKKKGHKYGGIFVGPSPRLVLLDLEIIKQMFTKDLAYFTSRGIYCNEKVEPIFTGIFNSGGSKWREMRRKLTPTFTTGKLKGMVEVMVECGERMQEWLGDEKEGFDAKEVCSWFTMDSLICCMFGIECDSFKNPDSEIRMIGRKVFGLNLGMRIIRFLSTAAPGFAKLLGLKTIDSEGADMFYKLMRKIIAFKQAGSVKCNDFLQMLVDLMKGPNKENLQRKERWTQVTLDEIVAESFFFYTSGYEALAIPMHLCLYELAKHPEIQQKLRKEMKKVLERNGGKITYEGVKDMKYLGQVIDEAQRIYPTVPTLTRKCDKDYRLPGTNLTIQRGVTVVVPLYAIHHDERYHPNPYNFDPERFNDENKAKLPPYAYMPFGDGLKMCIANRFSLLLIKIGLCVLLTNFEFTINPKTRPIEINKAFFLLTTKSPIFLNCKRCQFE